MAPAMSQIGLNDAVLVISLIYLSADISYEWEEFSECDRPIHKWLLGSYGLITLSRLVYVAGSLAASGQEGDFLLNLREKSPALRALMSVMWLVILPTFTLWSFIGTAWIWDVRHKTPQCLQSGVHMWFLIVWQVLSYLWILIHLGLGGVAWYLERRVRCVEGDLRQLEDADVLSRWGQVSRLHGYASLPGTGLNNGLSPAQIAALPGASLVDASECRAGEECPICLHTLQPGDMARQLNGCCHTFHRPCIDLWLLRRADCPLCKREVKAGEAKSPIV